MRHLALAQETNSQAGWSNVTTADDGNESDLDAGLNINYMYSFLIHIHKKMMQIQI
jgi:hypothetical protein